jgi:DNA topoisomerase-1
MAKNLVIVESPAKAKTIGKYLGSDFDVMASYGHVRDLVPKEGAVDPDDGFAMKYQIIERNEKHVNAIVRALKKAEALYLATDPDREGEAISWHLTELLREKKALNGKPVHRVVFHEITKNAIREAIDNPRSISNDLVSAQQARRALDYLVGFNLSPLLWKGSARTLPAGCRARRCAVVERELEIEAFKARSTGRSRRMSARTVSLSCRAWSGIAAKRSNSSASGTNRRPARSRRPCSKQPAAR